MDETSVSRRRMLALAGSTVAAGAAGCLLDAPADTADSDDFPSEFDTPDGNFDQAAANTELTQVYRDVVPSVTAVQVRRGQRTGGGSAWVYDDSYLVTNDHVVRRVEDEDIHVWFTDTGWREASVVGTDLYSDLAVLEVTNKPEDATPLSLVEERLAVGTPVAAVGNPFGLTSSFTTGIISGRNRTIPIPQSDFSIADGIQTDAALNPGNSGGPLITHEGEVTGVVSAGGGDNIGFAISAEMVRSVVPDLIQNGEYDHTWLGIYLGDVQPPLIEANDLPVSWGVYVGDVTPDGPSDGILQGTQDDVTVDGQQVPVGGDVIVGMDDWTIPTSERLSAFLALETEPGDTIEIDIYRDGEPRTVEVELESRPSPDRE